MGQNPASGLLSLRRRREIYRLCSVFDIVIIEDDPYWYLQYPSANALSIANRGRPVSANYPTNPGHNYNSGPRQKSSGFPFLDSLVPSYLHVDTDGRVVRLDTFSKTVAPGCRLGWITAQPAFVERILRITETTTQQPSGFVQCMIAELVMGPQSPDDGGQGGSNDGSGWKVDGWVRWLEGLRGNYERRVKKVVTILEEGRFALRSAQRVELDEFEPGRPDEEEAGEYQVISKTQMYSFEYPMAGMFLWVHMQFETHPLFKKVDHERLALAFWILLTREPYRCLVAPGGFFSVTEELKKEKGWQYFRLCFAAVDEEELGKCSNGFVAGSKAFWETKKISEIDDILKDEDESTGAALQFDTMRVSIPPSATMDCCVEKATNTGTGFFGITSLLLIYEARIARRPNGLATIMTLMTLSGTRHSIDDAFLIIPYSVHS